jgi:hypothetical protein
VTRSGVPAAENKLVRNRPQRDLSPGAVATRSGSRRRGRRAQVAAVVGGGDGGCGGGRVCISGGVLLWAPSLICSSSISSLRLRFCGVVRFASVGRDDMLLWLGGTVASGGGDGARRVRFRPRVPSS